MQRLKDRQAVIRHYDLPTLLDLAANGALLTGGYRVGVHLDGDDPDAYACGSWHEYHEKHCKHSEGTCKQAWFLIFPEYRIAIRLRQNIFICWDSSQAVHGTVLDPVATKGGCASNVYSCITQVKDILISRVLSAYNKGIVFH